MILPFRANADAFHKGLQPKARNMKSEDEEDAKLIRGDSNFHQLNGPQSSRSKFRRDSPNGHEQEANNNDDIANRSSLDDANLLSIFNRMKTRDVNGQTAKASTDTFNGKLIPCLIHWLFLPTPCFN